jgi:hypothetical protein
MYDKISGQTINDDGDYTEHNPHCPSNGGSIDDCTCSNHPDPIVEHEREERINRQDHNHHSMVAADCLPQDYETCGDCGFDHDYEYEAAAKWHEEHPCSYCDYDAAQDKHADDCIMNRKD